MEAFQKGLQTLLEADWKQLFSELKNHTVSLIKFFIHYVDWSERWIICLYSVILFWFLLIINQRYNLNFQILAFVIDSSIIFGGKAINNLAKKYWNLFASKDYFDNYGMFYSFMVSFPLLLITVIQIFLILFSMIKMNMEIQRMRKLNKKYDELNKINERINSLEEKLDNESDDKSDDKSNEELRKRK